MYTIALPVFEGPLDLLLHLIEQAKLDITVVALAQVTDQYLAHVRTLDAPDPAALAEFVALASRLLLIKSRTLLPQSVRASTEPVSVEDDSAALARQLREYQQYKRPAAFLRTWQSQGRQVFQRMAMPPVSVEPGQRHLDHVPADLIAALERRIQLALPLAEKPVGLSLIRRLTVDEVVARIREHLLKQAGCSFDDLLLCTTTRQEIVVSFWAVLELWKRQSITVRQAVLFGPISIERGMAFERSRMYGQSV